MHRLKIHAVLIVLLAPFAMGFRASVVKIDITPEDTQWLVGYYARQSDGVHDPLFHRIVAMEDGDSLFILIASDLGGYSPSFYHAFRKQLEDVIKTKDYQVWWTITHTHSGPEVGPVTLAESFMPERFTHEFNVEYPQKITQLLIEGIQEAIAKLEPVRVGVGKGMALANINRRARTADGKNCSRSEPLRTRRPRNRSHSNGAPRWFSAGTDRQVRNARNSSQWQESQDQWRRDGDCR